MSKENHLAVAEAFYSIQGEAQTMGRPSIFIRLAGCNLMCGGKGTEKDGKLHNGATWRCDTIEVWLKGKKKSHEELIQELDARFGFLTRLKHGSHLIITGGEPLLQQNQIVSFLYYLSAQYGIEPFTEIETNGTIEPIYDLECLVDLFNVSPKLTNSGESNQSRDTGALKKFANLNAQYKFVVSEDEEIQEVISIMTKYKLKPVDVWLMPAASDRDTLNKVSKYVIQNAMTYGLNYSHRLHIEIWNQKTGV